MSRNKKQYTEEFKNTVVEIYNAGKSITDLSNEYAISKSTIHGWIKKNKPVVIDDTTTVTAAEYKKLLKRMAQIEEENEILKKAMGIFARK